MSEDKYDIGDDEIRIIKPSNKPESSDITPMISSAFSDVAPFDDDSEEIHVKPSKSRKVLKRCGIALIVIVVLLLAFAIVSLLRYSSQPPEDSLRKTWPAESQNAANPYNNSSTEYKYTSVSAPGEHKYTEITDTTITGLRLKIFTPRNATPVLQVGEQALADPEAVLVAQAADIRGDNYDILGAFVLQGELLSKGSSKTGFCAIIDGKPIIGSASSTPYLEQAIDTKGYFFRQFPLVVGNQVVENKEQRHALRKALVELNGATSIVITEQPMSLHDFSEVLVKLGVTNAITLVGSTSYGFACNESDHRIEFGKRVENPAEKVSYILWK